MKQISSVIVVLGCSFLLFACSGKSSLNPKEFIRWVESDENGLFGVKVIEGLEYKIHYRPHEYITLKSQLRDSSISADSMRNQLGDLQYFTFQMKNLNGSNSPLKCGLSSETEYYDRIGYLSFGVQNDIKLIENGDTLNCVLAVFERNFNVAPTNTLSLAFESKKPLELAVTKEFVFNDKVFGNGPIRIIIDKENIENIPELKL